MVLSNHQLLQFRQTQKRVVIDGPDLVGSQVDPLQLAWKATKDEHSGWITDQLFDHQNMNGLIL